MADKMTEKQDYSLTFVKSAISIFESELNTELKKRLIHMKHSSQPSFSFSIVIEFVSKSFSGQVVYSMSKEVAEGFARKMFPNMLPAERKKLIKDILGEVANMISGKASIALAGSYDKINIDPPIVIVDSKIAKIGFLQVPTAFIVLDSTIGSLEINIAFQGAKKKYE